MKTLKYLRHLLWRNVNSHSKVQFSTTCTTHTHTHTQKGVHFLYTVWGHSKVHDILICRDRLSSCNIYAVQQDNTKCFNECVLFITYVSSTCFGPHRSITRNVLQAVFADLVCGNMRTTRHFQPLRSCSSSYNFLTAGRVE